MYSPAVFITLWDLSIPGVLLLSIVLVAIYFVRVRIR